LRPQNYTTGNGGFTLPNPPVVNGLMKQNSNVYQTKDAPAASFISDQISSASYMQQNNH